MSRGFSCTKGRQFHHLLTAPNRLTATMRRVDGELVADDPSTILDEIAARLAAISAAHGPTSIALYCGNGATFKTTLLPTAHAFLWGIGSHQFYSSLTIDQPAKITAAGRVGVWAGGCTTSSRRTWRCRSATTSSSRASTCPGRRRVASQSNPRGTGPRPQAHRRRPPPHSDRGAGRSAPADPSRAGRRPAGRHGADDARRGDGRHRVLRRVRDRRRRAARPSSRSHSTTSRRARAWPAATSRPQPRCSLRARAAP